MSQSPDGVPNGRSGAGKANERFQPAAFAKLDEPVQKARACVKAGRFEMAANFYNEALRTQPRNWYLMGEVTRRKGV